MGKAVPTEARGSSNAADLFGSGPDPTEWGNFIEKDSTSGEQKTEDVHNNQVCFGMVRIITLLGKKDRFTDFLQQIAGIPITQYRRDHFRTTSLVPAVLDGENVKRSDKASPVGVISKSVAEVLQCLDEDENFEVQAFYQFVEELDANIRLRPKELQSQKQRSLVLNVNIYGAPNFYDGLGAFLTEVDLFLQTPENCDKNVEYRNPQLLTRPSSTPIMTISLSANMIMDDCSILESDGVIDTSNLRVLLQNTPHLEETPSPVSLATKLHGYLHHA
jgi:hypothetical protein